MERGSRRIYLIRVSWTGSPSIIPQPCFLFFPILVFTTGWCDPMGFSVSFWALSNKPERRCLTSLGESFSTVHWFPTVCRIKPNSAVLWIKTGGTPFSTRWQLWFQLIHIPNSILLFLSIFRQAQLAFKIIVSITRTLFSWWLIWL